MTTNPFDYRAALTRIAASAVAAPDGPSLPGLIQSLQAELQCDAAFLIERADASSVACRFMAGGDAMLESICSPALLANLSPARCAIVQDYPASPNPEPIVQAWGARSVILLPIFGRPHSAAAVVLAWKTTRDFPPDLSHELAPLWALLQALYPREQAEKELVEVREFLSAILQTIPQAVVFIDHDGSRAWVNDPAARLLQLPSGAVSPSRISAAMRDLRRAAANAPAIEARAADELRNVSAEIKEWIWEFREPRRVFNVSSRMTDIHGVFGRLWVFLDITALTEAEAALAQTEERWQLALQGTNQGIWDWNALTGEVFYSNRWKEMLGYENHEIPNTSAVWEQLVHPEDLPRVRSVLQNHLDRKTPHYEAEYRALCKDGSWKWLLARGQAIWNADGHATRLVGTHSDITSRKRNEALLVEAKHAADEANSAKSRFLARMSHEIRTPMNAICGLSDALLETPLNAEQQEYVRVFRANADRLLRLINNILDLSRVEADAFELERRPFRIPDVIVRVGDLLQSLARAKGLALQFSVDPRLAPVYWGDADRVEQILINLIGNALKFTDSGSVSVSVRPREDAAPNGAILFEIRDTGPGIDPAQLSSIFEAFVQAESHRILKKAGSGLGLAISRKLVELMGGDISVESRVGHGSCFRFTLALEPASAIDSPAADLARLSAVAAASPLDGARVLVAEDNPDNRFVLRAYLRNLNLDLEFAEDGAQALRQAESQQWDIILMDVQMPELDGLEVTRRIRTRESRLRLRHTPIIALTAFALPEEKEKCLQAGCDQYLSKPIARADLLAAMQRALPAAPTPAADPAPAAPADDPDAVDESLMEEIRALIPAYLSGCERDVANIGQWVEAGDYDSIRKIAHNLQGSGGCYGLPKISETGLRLSAAAKAKDQPLLREITADLRRIIAESQPA